MGLPLYVTWCFSFAALNILFLFCMLNAFTMVWCGGGSLLILVRCLKSFLYLDYHLFLNIWKFSAITLLNIFSMLLACTLSCFFNGALEVFQALVILSYLFFIFI
jgi:hypothetical protein